MSRVLLATGMMVAVGIIPATAQYKSLQQQQILTQQQPAEAESSTTPVATVIVPAATDKPTQKLGDVKKIFVAPLGTGEGSELIRQKVINRLIKSGNITLVDSSEDADAILTGVTEINHRKYLVASIGPSGGFASGGTRYSAELVVRLIGKNKQVLWTNETTSRRYFGGSRSVSRVSSNVTDKMVKDLINAIAIDKVPVVVKENTHS